MAGGKRKKKPDVIDVGDAPARGSAEENSEGADGEDEAEGDGDGDAVDDMVASAATIDVGDEAHDDGDDHEPVEPPTRGGSLARRDPLAAYMAETRRYPLLTPEEEHALAVRLVEHNDTGAARSARGVHGRDPPLSAADTGRGACPRGTARGTQ